MATPPIAPNFGGPWEFVAADGCSGARSTVDYRCPEGPLMKALLSAPIVFALCYGHVVQAQMTGMAAPTPTISATSPLGTGPGTPIPPTGISLGATELSSAGFSPLGRARAAAQSIRAK